MSWSKENTHKSLSPQMALLHLRWKQIRELELQTTPFLGKPQESTSNAHTHSRDKAYIPS